MIQKLGTYQIRPLSSLSPSQYHSAIGCPYKLVLANAFGRQVLLPANANAHFGSVIHKMMELISKGEIDSEQVFIETWAYLINKKETELTDKGFTHITPLKYFVTDFGLKKNQVRAVLQKRLERINLSPKSSQHKPYPEIKLENPDKTIRGVADLVIEDDFGATIFDFKTGRIYSDAVDESGVLEPVIKKEYEIQLKLYAHLYFLMNRKYPRALFLVTLSNSFLEVKFNETECTGIYSEALKFFENTNSLIRINNLDDLGKPSVDNCKFCSHRPACKFYANWLMSNFESVNDIFGTITKVNQFNNGTLGLQLQMNDKQILINGMSSNMKDDFEALVGKNVVLYNLRKNKQSLNATANNFTVIYE